MPPTNAIGSPSHKLQKLSRKISRGNPREAFRETMKRPAALLLLSLAISWAQDQQTALIYDLSDFNEAGAWSERIGYCPDFRTCDPFLEDNEISSACVTGM